MSIKSFLIKKALQAKGVSKEQAENIADQLTANPELAEKLKKLEEKKNAGTPEQYAMMAVMTKYKDQITKHREDLMPLMQLLGGAMPGNHN